MSGRRVWLGTIVVSVALVLSACSKSSTPAASTALGSSGAPAPSLQGVNPGGGFCSELKTENAKSAQFSKTFGTAAASQNITSIKQTLGTYFTQAEGEIARVEATMTSAPANVQAALTTINHYFSQLQSAISSATSMQQLEASMASLGKDAASLKGAAETLKAYATSQCGSVASP